MKLSDVICKCGHSAALHADPKPGWIHGCLPQESKEMCVCKLTRSEVLLEALDCGLVPRPDMYNGPLEFPHRKGKPEYCVRPTKSYPRLKSITHAERERTPEAFAKWLIDLARRTAKEPPDAKR
jgi:hypothetical protein